MKSSLRHILLATILTIAVANFTAVAAHQATKGKGQPSQKKTGTAAKKGPYKYTLTWSGKSYEISSAKPLPVAELKRLFSGEDKATLETQLSASRAARDQLTDENQRLLRRIDELETEVSDKEDELNEKEAEVDHLKENAEDAVRAFSDVEFAFGRVKRSVSDFGYYDWKIVVPDVESKVRTLGHDIDTLSSAINDLTTITNVQWTQGMRLPSIFSSTPEQRASAVGQ